MAHLDARKSTIAIVISNLEFGGAQQQIVALANNLDPGQFKVHVISLAEFVPLASSLKIPADRQHIIAKRWKYDITVPFRLALFLRSINAGIVHGFLFDAEIACRLAAKLAGVPICIGSERNCDYTRSKIQLLAYRITKSLQTSCIANTNAGASFNSKLLGYPMEHYAVVHNGVNTRLFRPASGRAIRERHDIGEDDIVIGVFGSFKAQKNHKLFFRMAAALAASFENLRFLLVGDQLHGGIHGSDRYKEEVNELVDELAIRHLCVFAGNQDQVAEYYRACDLTVLSSDHEGMPNVVLESLASGVPVVATDVSDNKLLLPDGEVGFLVPKKDLEQLTERVSILIEDRDLLQRMSERSVVWIEENFSAQKMAQKMAQAYLALL
jgi:glycosyltransferase involved in cell wall biosynthesis